MIGQMFGERYSGRRIGKRHLDCRISVPPEYKLKNIPHPVVFSVDKVFDASKSSGDRCDEFIFSGLNQNDTDIHLVERKTNSTNVTKVAEQLQGGADFIEQFAHKETKLGDYIFFRFMPVWVSKGIKPSLRSQLINIKISLFDVKKPIVHVKKGGSLTLLKMKITKATLGNFNRHAKTK